MSAPKYSIEKLKSLEAEKKNLLIEIEELKKMADTKATELEIEVGALRDEVMALKTLINKSETNEAQTIKKISTIKRSTYQGIK